MADNINTPFNGAVTGTTGNQQMQAPFGNNSQSGSFLGNYAPNGDMGKIGNTDTVTGLINRMVERAMVDTWSYDVPYLKYMRQLPVDMMNKVVQMVAPKVGKGREFDPYNGARLIERHYAENEQRVYAINFTRQYVVSIAVDLLKRGASMDALMSIVAQQIQNLMNDKNVELTEKINEVISNFIIQNQDKLVNIQFNPKDPNNPTEDELTNLSAKIDEMNMRMTRFVGTDFSLSDVGYITKYEDLVIDTTVKLPAELKNKVFPYAFNNSYFTYSSGIPSGDGKAADKINVMNYLPDGVWGIVRDKNMLTIGQALNEMNADQTGMAYTRSYNVVHNFWAAIFMDVFKRCYIISTLPDNMPTPTQVSLASIAAALTNAAGNTVTSYSMSNPSALNLQVTPTGNVSPATANIKLPSEHHVDIAIVDADNKPVKVTKGTYVDDLDRVSIQKNLQPGSVVTFTVTSNYNNPSATVTATKPAPITTTTQLKITQ